MLGALERQGTYINVGTLTGHNSICRQVMGQEVRAPTPSELQLMKIIVAHVMNEGAFRVSTGLAYTPGRFSTFNESVVFAKTAADLGGIYASHIRNEAIGGEEAIREALAVGKESGAVVHTSHIKCSGRMQWNSMWRRLRLLDEARASGLRVFTDAYPYERSSTTTDIMLPDWAVADKCAGVRLAASNQQARQKLRQDILNRLRTDGWHELEHVRLVTGSKAWIGRTLAEVPLPARTLDQQIDNLIQISIRGGAQAIFADMNELDVTQAISNDFCVIGSDSAVRDPEGEYQPHSRGSGTFPRIFKLYVRETGRLSLSQAVRKASGLAAEIFGLDNRGHINEGEWADVVMFDLSTIEDRADYDQPFAQPIGIDYVIVNGVIVIEDGSFTENQPAGFSLRKQK